MDFFQISSNIFEHIRCDRLLEAGFTILSETSYKLDMSFVNKYTNLKQLSYDDFFNINNKPKIIDCFTFYNEIDLLNYRLSVLNDVVDYFVIVEATHTHVGKKKYYIFKENEKNV